MISELLQQSSLSLWLLCACSILGFAIVVEKLLFFRRTHIQIDQFIRGISVFLQEKAPEKALEKCSTTPGAEARVLSTAIANRQVNSSELRLLIHESAQQEIPQIEKHLHLLFALVFISPLLGFLGTIFALLANLNTLKESATGTISSTALLSSLHTALFSSAIGLILALLLYLFYTYFAAKTRNKISAMQRCALEIIPLLKQETH